MPGRRTKYHQALEGLRKGKSYDKSALSKADSILSEIPDMDETEKGLKTQVGRRLKAHAKQEKNMKKSKK